MKAAVLSISLLASIALATAWVSPRPGKCEPTPEPRPAAQKDPPATGAPRAPQPGASEARAAEALAKKNGCLECHSPEKNSVGPAFRTIAAKYKSDVTDYDITFMSVSSVGDLPEQRKSAVIVARVGGDMHVRIFDADGRRVVDKGGANLAVGPQLDLLKEQLKGERVPDGKALTRGDSRKVLEAAAAAAGRPVVRNREVLIEVVKKGGKGKWTAVSRGVPMPPHGGRLTDAEIATLVDWILAPAVSPQLKVLKTGLGSGTVTANPAGLDCGGTCDATYTDGATVTLTATPDAGSEFVKWEGDATGTAATTTVTMSGSRAVRAEFMLSAAIPQLTDLTPGGIQTYLTANPHVNTPARFLSALPRDFRQNWLLMSRSESLQTGTAASPRILLPSADARAVFTVGMTQNSSYPGSHPSAVEYMQWDAAEKNFRFHEIVLDAIPVMDGGTFPARTRGVVVDDVKCSKCHSTQNVLNRSTFPGTSGVTPGTVKVKNKPNWDAYDSWGGLLPFNRDRIYQGSVEEAAFRRILNLWNWRNSPANDGVRQVLEQLELQPPWVGDTSPHSITRNPNAPADEEHIRFGFDGLPAIPTSSVSVGYSFGGTSSPATPVTQEGRYVTMRHSNSNPPTGTSNDQYLSPGSDEGRGVQLFDLLGGLDSTFNAERIADELISHRFATGGGPIDVRPVALAVTRGWITYDAASGTIRATPALTVNMAFFDTRNGMSVKDLVNNTRERAESLPRRKADIEKFNLHRADDAYLWVASPEVTNGLIAEHGGATAGDTSLPRLRREVFRRPLDLGAADKVTLAFVDREFYSQNTNMLALYRYFLEPLGVSVDKWSMGVRGRSRNYTFADVFGSYTNIFTRELAKSLTDNPVPGLSDPNSRDQVIAAVNSTLASLPAANETPAFTDVQRIFNRSCIECHGGLNYPPYRNSGTTFVNFSEDESPPAGSTRLDRSYDRATIYSNPNPANSLIIQLLTNPSEVCTPTDFGMMPCGGPALSTTDIETLRRWMVGGSPSTNGDPHVQTVNGVNYDFQATGEFVLLRGEGLEVQTRQVAVGTQGPLGPDAYTGIRSCVSVNGAVALRLGKHRITYQPNRSGKPDPAGLELRINGTLTKLGAEGVTLEGGVRVRPTTVPGGIQVEGRGGTAVVITPGWWDHYQVWYLNIDTRHVRATRGLMGTVSPGNWLPAMPNGTLLGPKPEGIAERYKVLYEKFGSAWRVTDKDSLFDYAPGTNTKTFTVADWPNGHNAENCKAPSVPGGPVEKVPQKSLTREQAAQLCKDITDPDRREKAILDVMTTGEPGFAKTYLQADEIRRHKPPAAPVLDSPGPRKAVNAAPVLAWKKPPAAEDAGPLKYKVYVWPLDEAPEEKHVVRVTQAEANADAVMVNVPVPKLTPGKTYYWKVVVEDRKGGTTESEIRRFDVKK